jgi:ABC-type protease/lipase transport system fused ATPase/permease subunit
LSEPFQFWAPSQVTVKSWANINDDDDDYRATTARLAEDHSPELPLPDPDSRLSQEEVRSSSSPKPPKKKGSGTWICYEFESCAKKKIVSSGIDDKSMCNLT